MDSIEDSSAALVSYHILIPIQRSQLLCHFSCTNGSMPHLSGMLPCTIYVTLWLGPDFSFCMNFTTWRASFGSIMHVASCIRHEEDAFPMSTAFIHPAPDLG